MGAEDRKTMEEQIKDGEMRERSVRLKKHKERLKKERISFFADFKKFITKGNVLDLAVAVVIANAFNAIVNGLVKYIITPCVTYLTSGVSINEWEYVLQEEDAVTETVKVSIQYGLWLQAILDFFIIALSIFVALRIIRRAERKLNARKIQQAEAEQAKKQAEEAQKNAEAKALADAKQAELDAFYANVREQSALLRDIRESLRK